MSQRPKHVSLFMVCNSLSDVDELGVQSVDLRQTQADIQLFSRCIHSRNICSAHTICQAMFEISTVQQKYDVSHMCDFRCSISHIKK